MRPRWTLLATCILTVTACGGGDDQPADDGGTTTSTASPAVAGVGVTETSLGEMLVGPEGMTLYGFTVDEPGISNCYDDCAQLWPPLAGDTPIGEDLDPSLFSVTERDDGSTQLVIGDWPLYYYTPDTSPGDVNGQGVGGVWFVVAPDGELIGAGEASAGEASAGEATAQGGEATERTAGTDDYGYDYGVAGGLKVAETELGPTVVDADGMTLYGFTPDSPTASACAGPCAETWPPVPGESAVGEGLDEAMFSMLTREDGRTQLVFGDWPLYRYAGDGAPGEVNGQGVNDVWFAVAPDGSLYR